MRFWFFELRRPLSDLLNFPTLLYELWYSKWVNTAKNIGFATDTKFRRSVLGVRQKWR